MNNRVITILSLALSLALIAILCVQMFRAPARGDLAFVRSADLIYGYAGMKEAQQNFKLQHQGLQAQLDSLQTNYNRAWTTFVEQEQNMSTSEKQSSREELATLQQNLNRYANSVEQKAKEEEARMLEGVFTQINSLVQDYAEERGYAMIMGTTQSGNLLYGQAGMDVTEDLLASLNNQYYGE